MFPDEVCSNAYIEIVVSPVLNKKVSRQLQVLWWVEAVDSSDTISLYMTDPQVNLTRPAFTMHPSSTHGWADTLLNEFYVDITESFEPVCLGFWAIYWRGRASKFAYA